MPVRAGSQLTAQDRRVGNNIMKAMFFPQWPGTCDDFKFLDAGTQLRVCSPLSSRPYKISDSPVRWEPFVKVRAPSGSEGWVGVLWTSAREEYLSEVRKLDRTVDAMVACAKDLAVPAMCAIGLLMMGEGDTALDNTMDFAAEKYVELRTSPNKKGPECDCCVL